MRFSNCCVYINEPKTIDDERSVNMITRQYENDKQKIFPTLRANFIKTCLFLINKSDEIETNEEKMKLENNIVKNISIVEKNINRNNINISFCSGKFFLKYMEVYFNYVNLLENSPDLLFLKLYNKFNRKSSRFFFMQILKNI